MKRSNTIRHIALGSLLTMVFLASSGCLVGRIVKLDAQWDIPNDLHDRGFRYVKRGVEVRYRVEGILPAKLNRAQLMAKMDVTQGAYYHIWRKAGGLRDNQRMVNVVVETSFVQLTGFGAKLFLVVHMYADIVEVSTAPATSSGPDHHPGKSQLMARIARSVSAAMAAQRGS